MELFWVGVAAGVAGVGAVIVIVGLVTDVFEGWEER